MQRLVLIAFLFITSQAWSSQRYVRALTIDHTQAPSTQTNFPVLVSYAAEPTFKTTGNGGHVTNSNGFDIAFYSDLAHTTLLKWEKEAYDGTGGTIIYWVKIPSVSSSSDTTFYMFYGDATITTDQSDALNVWTNSYKNVWHMKNSVTLDFSDSLNANNGGSSGSPSSTPGQIGTGAKEVHASSQYIIYSNNVQSTAMTFSAWVKFASLPVSDFFAVYGQFPTTGIHDRILVPATGKLLISAGASADVSYNGTGSHTLTTGTWYYISETYNSTSGLVGYVNAASDATVAANGNLNITSSSLYVGNDPATATRYMDGVMDNVTLSSVARTNDWITCEYNNQLTPSSFVGLGSETDLQPPTSTFFYFFP